MKKEEQRSSFITITINNANSTAAAAIEAGEREGVGAGTGGCMGWDYRGQTVKWEQGPGRACRQAKLRIAEIW